MDVADAVLGGGEIISISDDDEADVCAEATATNYAGVRVMFTTTEAEGDITQFTITMKGYGTSDVGDGAFLYLWDDELSDWELVDSDGGAVKATLTSTVAADMTDYFNASNELFALLISDSTHPTTGSDLHCYYAELSVIS